MRMEKLIPIFPILKLLLCPICWNGNGSSDHGFLKEAQNGFLPAHLILCRPVPMYTFTNYNLAG